MPEREWTLQNYASWARERESPWGGDSIVDGPRLVDDESVVVVPKADLDEALDVIEDLRGGITDRTDRRRREELLRKHRPVSDA